MAVSISVAVEIKVGAETQEKEQTSQRRRRRPGAVFAAAVSFVPLVVDWIGRCLTSWPPIPGGWQGMAVFFFALSLAAATFGPETAWAGDLTIRQIGAWGGSVNAVHVEQQGDQRIAYIGSGVRMVILNVTDPGNIIELSSVMFDGVVMSVAVLDGYAYVGAGPVYDHPSPTTPTAWFCVVDVHDVTAPFLVASGLGSRFSDRFKKIVFDGTGQTAYAAPRDTGVPRAIDISDPTAPVYVGACGGGLSPVFSGSLQYWVSPGGGFVGTMDMSAAPDSCPGVLGGYVQIPEYDHAGDQTKSVLVGDYLYVVANINFLELERSLLFVVDFSNLDEPVHVGTWGDPTGETLDLGFGNGGDVAVSDGRLYWAGWGLRDPLSRSMVILDVATDPINPQLIGEYSSAADFGAIEVVGTTAYLGDGREGLVILDCSDPANPVRAGGYFSPNNLSQAALDGDHLYVTDLSYGVSIVDVSDSQAPALVGQWETGTYTGNRQQANWGIAARDGFAYVAAGLAGFQVLDVSDPSAPSLAGEFSPWPQGAKSVGLTLSPNEPIVHLGKIPGAWIINMDVSDPSNIVDVGAVNIGGLESPPYTIDRRSDGIAYVARVSKVVTVDLSDAASPVLLGTAESPFITLDLAVDGDHLYVVNDSPQGPEVGGLDIFDVSGADHLPIHLAHAMFDDINPVANQRGLAVTVSDGLAYVAERYSLWVLDVSNPASAVTLGQAPTAFARNKDLVVDGHNVYAITESPGDGGAGVLVYRVFSPGDADDDGNVDLRDYAALQRCFSGEPEPPGGRVSADCLVFDFDFDDDVDDTDYAAFRAEISQPQ